MRMEANRELIDTGRYLDKLSIMYWHANDIPNAIAALQHAIRTLKNNSKTFPATLAAMENHPKQYPTAWKPVIIDNGLKQK